MRNLLSRLRTEDGATAVEYAVMLALILAVVLASIVVVGNNTKALCQSNSGSIQAVTGS